jgi:hypothetical protein
MIPDPQPRPMMLGNETGNVGRLDRIEQQP